MDMAVLKSCKGEVEGDKVFSLMSHDLMYKWYKVCPQKTAGLSWKRFSRKDKCIKYEIWPESNTENVTLDFHI